MEDSVIIDGISYPIASPVREEFQRLREALAKAKCPDPDCDGEGTCAAMVPGYDGEGDIDCWECQWCAERKALLGEME